MAVSADDEYRDLEHALREVFPDASVEVSPSQSRGHAPAALADVHLAGGSLHLRVELQHAASRAQLIDAVELARLAPAEEGSSIPVIASPYLSPASQQLLRDANAAFIDYAGNAWFVAPGIHIDRRGFANLGKEERGQRDLFSDKASLILRTLLIARSPMGVREIASTVSSKDERIGLTPGYVSKVVGELERRGYAARSDEKIVLRHAQELLRDWTSAYRGRRRPAPVSYFVLAPSAEDLLPRIAASFDAKGADYVFTGHAGASLVDRHTVFDVADVYVKDLEDVAPALADLGARRVERGGNVNMSVPYYRQSAFYDCQLSKGGMKVASDLQLYLDLYDYPVRGREQAEHLYERRLRSLVERDDRL
ncbi:MAG: type IV toxin-antitoxin system AbiEi family antitoxin [Coriobacteriia bacterium]|nr:type IV toxin-antitoxin system AbiEi family antitoxin [Coriobacteriia bacterium]